MHNLDLVHFHAYPLNGVHSVEQQTRPSSKPRGLWVSVEGNGDGWSDWCKAEKFRLENLKCQAKIKLHENSNILLLTSSSDIDLFNETYREKYCKPYDYNAINWVKVASKYSGIIIAPYVWSRRLDCNTMWYYGWDCASGCIWDAKTIKSIQPCADICLVGEAAGV